MIREQVFASFIHASLARCFRLLERHTWVALPVVLAVAQAGCSTKPLTDPIIGPDHVLHNIYRKEGTFEGSVKRVAVLPLSYNESTHASGASAGEILEPIFHAELTKAGRFECYFVKPAQLQLWTGRERWDDFDELPASFLKTVAERTGCDGVLFSRISHFKAYPPIVIGWRMRLVSDDAGVLWSADELFDAADPAVSNSARRYNRGRPRSNPVLEDSRSILLSPSEFGQYTLESLFGTLPIR